MPSITFTVSATDATRITNAAASLGYPDAKTMVVSYVTSTVAGYEHQQAIAALVPAPPISPT